MAVTVEQNDYIRDVEETKSPSLEGLNDFVEKKFQEFVKEKQKTGLDFSMVKKEFNQWLDDLVEKEKNKAIVEYIKSNNFDFNNFEEAIKVPSYSRTFSDSYIQELAKDMLYSLNSDSVSSNSDYQKEQQKNIKIVQEKVVNFYGKEVQSFLNALPDTLKSQHTKLTKALFEKKIPIDNESIKSDMERMTKKVVKSLWNNKPISIQPSQYADVLFYEYTGAVLYSDQKSIDFAEGYEVKDDTNKTEKKTLQNRVSAKRNLRKIMTHIDGNTKLGQSEKRLVNNFINIVYSLEKDDENKKLDTPLEKVLLDYIHEHPNEAIGNTESEWIDVMEKQGVVVKNRSAFGRFFGKKGTKALQTLAQAYVAANNINSPDSFPGFATFASLIRKYGSFEAAYTAFDDQMEQYKQFREKTDVYKHVSDRNYEIDKDATRALRFQELKNTIYKNVQTNVDTQVAMLSDFNLDGNINYGDAYRKTGLQFTEMFKTGDKTEKLNNIIAAFNRGKKTETTIEEAFTSQEKFDALQSFIKSPPIDLHLIVEYGEEAIQKNIDRAQEMIKMKNELASATRIKGQKLKNDASAHLKALEEKGEENWTAQEKKQYDALKKLQSMPEKEFYHGLRDLLEGQLVSMTQNGVGLAAGVSLDKVLEGLSFNVGWTFGQDNWEKGFGVNLAWNGSAELRSGGGMYGGLSAGTVLLAVPIVSGNVGVYHNFENKNRNEDLDTDNIKVDYIVNAGAHAFVLPSILTWGVGFDLGVDTDRRAAVEKQYNVIKNDLKTMAYDIIDSMSDKGIFMYDREKLVNKDSDGILQEKYPKTENFEKVLNNMEPLLQYFHEQDLNTEGMREVIAQNFQDAYALQWKNEAIQHLDDQGRYLSGGGLSVTFLEGVIPVIGILKFKNHRITGYADKFQSRQVLKNANEKGTGNTELAGDLTDNVDKLNATLGSKVLEKNGNLVQVNIEDGVEIHIDPKMKGVMKQAEDGSILLHPTTPVRAFRGMLGRGQKVILNIGDEKTDTDDIIIRKTEDLSADMFTDKDIAVDKIPSLGAVAMTQEKFNKQISDLKQKMEGEDTSILDSLSWDPNGKIRITDTEGNQQVVDHNTHNITVSKKQDGSIFYEATKNTSNNFTITVEIAGKNEKEDPIEVGVQTQEQIDNFYDQMPNITSYVLANIAHPSKEFKAKYGHLYGKIWNKVAEWRKVLDNVNGEKKWDTLKNIMSDLLPMIQKRINASEGPGTVNFQEQIDFLNSADDMQKKQLLLALDGMFSRTHNVKGKGNETYELQYDKVTDETVFEKIMKGNQKAILEKMEKEYGKGSDVVKAYTAMFNAMMEKYKDKVIDQKTQKKLIEQSTIQAKRMLGVAYNHGGQDNERPIFNPMIIAGTQIKIEELLGENSKYIPVIKRHIAEQLINKDRSLIEPLIKDLEGKLAKRNGGGKVQLTPKELIELIATGRIKKPIEEGLDKGKEITISAICDVYAALFAQCVNHMIVAGNLKFMVDGKNILSNDKVHSETIKGEGSTVKVNMTEGQSVAHTDTKNMSIAIAKKFDTEEETSSTDPSGGSNEDGDDSSTVAEDENTDNNPDHDVEEIVIDSDDPGNPDDPGNSGEPVNEIILNNDENPGYTSQGGGFWIGRGKSDEYPEKQMKEQGKTKQN